MIYACINIYALIGKLRAQLSFFYVTFKAVNAERYPLTQYGSILQ